MCALLIPLHIHIALNVLINITIKNQIYQNIYKNKEDIKKVPNNFIVVVMTMLCIKFQ